MILAAPNAVPYTVPGKNLLVQASVELPNEDQGAWDSGTGVSAGGVRPKTLSISLTLPYDEAAEMQRLLAIAQAVTETGDRVVYDVVDNTAGAFGVRRAIFDGQLTAKERDSLQALDVSFALREVQSTAELAESRQEVAEVAALADDGTVLAPGEGDNTFGALLAAVQAGG